MCIECDERNELTLQLDISSYLTHPNTESDICLIQQMNMNLDYLGTAKLYSQVEVLKDFSMTQWESLGFKRLLTTHVPS
jgi:hypothetical protein